MAKPSREPVPPPPSGRDWWPFVESVPPGPALSPRLWAPALILAVALVLAVVTVF